MFVFVVVVCVLFSLCAIVCFFVMCCLRLLCVFVCLLCVVCGVFGFPGNPINTYSPGASGLPHTGSKAGRLSFSG